MLSDRIIGAFTFRQGVYAEVENDTTFTNTAWIIVAVIAFLNQLGTRAHGGGLFKWIMATIIGAIFAVLAFALFAYIINWVGRTVFYAEVTFEELVRTLGLAYVWNVVGVLGALVAFSDALRCISAPALVIAWLLGLAASLIAAKEALDLEWVQTIVTVVIGFVAMLIVMAIAGAVLSIFGLGAAALASAL